MFVSSRSCLCRISSEFIHKQNLGYAAFEIIPRGYFWQIGQNSMQIHFVVCAHSIVIGNEFPCSEACIMLAPIILSHLVVFSWILFLVTAKSFIGLMTNFSIPSSQIKSKISCAFYLFVLPCTLNCTICFNVSQVSHSVE